MHMAFLGEESQWAAEASECASDQGAFWQYHDKLFDSQNGENQGAFSKDNLKGFAKDLGLKTDEFNQCLDSGKYTQKVMQETQAAQTLGVQSTPSFYINDWLVLGALPVEEFDTYIAKAKAGQKPPPTPTPLPQGAQFWQPDPQRPGRDYDGSYYMGDAKAPVIILAFEDFSSPESAEHVKSVEPKLKSDYIDKGVARYVVQLYPLNAPKAAVAALCAGQQGKFFEFRNLLLTKQAEWKEGDEAAMQAYAKSLGLDEAAFASCLKDEKVQAQVDQYISFGQREVGVPQAPSYLMLRVNAQGEAENGKGYPGALPADQFFQAIQDMSVPPTPTPTPPPSISQAELASLQVGRDADGNFYRGDPNAPVKLVDFSDFQ
jgi:protein-disulfide isomerase